MNPRKGVTAKQLRELTGKTPMGQQEVVREWCVVPAAHTVHGATYDVVEWYPDEGSTGAIIARLHPSIRGVQGKDDALPIALRRALLMAASRELLKACEAAHVALSGGDAFISPTDALKLLDSAIALATEGRQ